VQDPLGAGTQEEQRHNSLLFLVGLPQQCPFFGLGSWSVGPLCESYHMGFKLEPGLYGATGNRAGLWFSLCSPLFCLEWKLGGDGFVT
jgi:hypothetical protein